MSQANTPVLDEDLTLHFHWRWGEHGIYLAVCSIIGLLVLALHLIPRPAKHVFCPGMIEVIQVHYLTSADEPPEQYDPFRDTRVIRPYKRTM